MIGNNNAILVSHCVVYLCDVRLCVHLYAVWSGGNGDGVGGGGSDGASRVVDCSFSLLFFSFLRKHIFYSISIYIATRSDAEYDCLRGEMVRSFAVSSWMCILLFPLFMYSRFSVQRVQNVSF